jgi:hypothetical protein
MVEIVLTKISDLVEALDTEGKTNVRLRQLVDSLKWLEVRRLKEDLAIKLIARKSLPQYRPPYHKRESNVLLEIDSERLYYQSPVGLSAIPDFAQLRHRIARYYSVLVLSPLVGQATLALQLFLAGQIGRLRTCRRPKCQRYFFRRKFYCCDACRAADRKALHPDEERKARSRRYLENKGIPDCERRIKRLEAERALKLRGTDAAELNDRIQRWKDKLRLYWQELKSLKKEEDK